MSLSAEYYCDPCSITFESNSEYQMHYLLHKDSEDFVSCNVCGKDFKNLRSFKSHMQTHKATKAFACDLCDATFCRKEDFRAHCFKHKGKMPYTCPICNHGFSRKGNLKAHSVVHTGKKPYNCMVCGKGFVRKEDQEHHMMLHNGNILDEICRLCNRSYATGSDHECGSESGKELNICEICHRMFSRKGNLKVHLLTHFNEKQYECSICQKSFTRKEDWSGHVLSHSGENLYTCEVCKKGFSRKSNYQSHLKIHERKVVCGQCGEEFATERGLKKHLMSNKSNCSGFFMPSTPVIVKLEHSV